MKPGPGPKLDAAVQAALAKLCNEPIWPGCFSTDWGTAGQLAEKLIADDYSFDVSYFEKDGWYAAFHKDDDAWEEYGESGPHAISLAALVAMEAAGE